MGFPDRRKAPLSAHLTTDQPTAIMNSKTILLSKTFWVQVVTVLSLAVPQVRDWLNANPESFVAALAAINLLVRFATSGRVIIFGAGESEKPPGGNGDLTGLLLMIGMGAATMGALPSCASGEFPMKVTAILEEGALSYSSKGGLEMEYRPGFGEMPKVYAEK